MTKSTITNEQLYELLIEFKRDVNRRFDESDRRFEEMDRRMTRLEENQHEDRKRSDEQFLELKMERREDNKRSDERFSEMKAEQREDRKMLMDIWKSRDKVTARVTWDFMWKAVSFNAVLLAVMLLVLKSA